MLLKISEVKIGKRIRMEYGEMQELADSIKTYGLLHPIVVDSHYNLIAGGRRLLACERISLKEIEAKVLGDLTDHELRVLELEENIKRKDLTELEKSKTIFELSVLKRKELEEKALQEIERLEKEELERRERERDKQGEEDQSGEEDFLTRNQISILTKIGRPQKVASFEKIAQVLNIPRSTLIDAQKHVEAVIQFPELENLPKYAAIEQAKQNNDPRVLDLAQQHKKREEETPHTEEPGTPDYGPYIDFCAKVSKNFNSVLYKVSALETDDRNLTAWKELLDEQGMIQGYVDQIDGIIPKLLKMQKFLKDLRK